MLDVVMHSPPKEPIAVYGSSYSMGRGSTRGRAIGNTFNIANAREVWSDFNSQMVNQQRKRSTCIYLTSTLRLLIFFSHPSL